MKSGIWEREGGRERDRESGQQWEAPSRHSNEEPTRTCSSSDHWIIPLSIINPCTNYYITKKPQRIVIIRNQDWKLRFGFLEQQKRNSANKNTKVLRTFVCNILNRPSCVTVKLSQKTIFAWTNKCNLHMQPVCVEWNVLYVWVHKGVSRFSLKDSLVSFYFEVSPFLKLMSIFVPAKRRTGTPRRFALQVQLVPFDQRLASHQPELRSRSWTERERKETQSELRQSQFPSCLVLSVVVHTQQKQL